MRTFVITGGRDFKHHIAVWKILDQIKPDLLILGDCPTGVDRFALEFCQLFFVPHHVHEAHWRLRGNAAGPERNERMVAEGKERGAILIAFPGGKGTLNCAQQAKAAGLEVKRVLPKQNGDYALYSKKKRGPVS